MKPTLTKKLSLSRETLRTLTDADLRAIAGAATGGGHCLARTDYPACPTGNGCPPPPTQVCITRFGAPCRPLF